jgi:hypothetical protein
LRAAKRDGSTNVTVTSDETVGSIHFGNQANSDVGDGFDLEGDERLVSAWIRVEKLVPR